MTYKPCEVVVAEFYNHTETCGIMTNRRTKVEGMVYACCWAHEDALRFERRESLAGMVAGGLALMALVMAVLVMLS